MSLTKDDLKQIKNLVEQSAADTTRNLSDKIDNTKEQILNIMDERFEEVDKQFEAVNREIADLAEINQAVISRTDKIENTLLVVKRKVGLATK